MRDDIKKISNKKVEGYSYFLFDGCHKFYLLKSGILTADMKDKGYKQSDIYPIDILPDAFSCGCPLRFISTWDGYKKIVPQFRNIVTFKNFGYRNFQTNFNKNISKVW